jgi:16S rRNA (adenine1518-N6/adenine1519-N6)-dimethyltransferase
MGTIDGLPPLREVIAAHDLVAKKAAGPELPAGPEPDRQDRAAAGDLTGCDVLEVGPGPGGLTRGLLAEGARRVLAVEKDAALPARAGRDRRAYPGRLEVMQWRRAGGRPAGASDRAGQDRGEPAL